MENIKQKNHRIGWIGTGKMGFPMAARLIAADIDVTVYNRTAAKAEPLGVKIVSAPAELSDCDIVYTIVTDDKAFLETVTGPKGVGIGVQQQMEEIGQRAFGNEWKQMFEDDFFKVAEGYIARLGRLASDTRVATSLENAGQFIPREISRKNFQGVLWQRLNKSLQKVDTSKAKLKEERRIAVEAQNKITDLEQGAKLDAAASRRVLDELQLTLDDLMEEVSELPEVMLPGSNRAISGIQKNLAEQSKVYAARSSVIGQELDQVNKILTAVRGAQAVADNPALFAQLERNINTIGNALKSYNMGQSKALLADETVAGMKRLEALLKGELDLGPLPKGFDRKDPAVKRFIAWEKIYKEAQKLDTELDASWMQLSRNDQEIFEAQRLIDQEIKNIEKNNVEINHFNKLIKLYDKVAVINETI